MLKRLISYGLLAVLTLGFVAACGTTEDDSAEPTVTRAATSNAPAVLTATAEAEAGASSPAAPGEGEPSGEKPPPPADGGPVALELEAVDIAFSTKELSGPADTEFTITITNNGATPHDFVIDELDINTGEIAPGDSATVTINAPAGEYTYYCSLPGHRPAGMEGVLTLAAAPEGERPPPPTEGEEESRPDIEAPPAGGGPVALEIETVDIAFSTNELSGPADMEFTITVTNNGVAQHDFVIEELDLATPLLNAGESYTLTVNAPAGEYTYFCSVPGHRALMEGKLTLSADFVPASTDEEPAEAATPAEEEAPTDAATPAAQEATPAEEVATPATEEATPAEEVATPVAEEATPAVEEATPAEEAVPVDEETAEATPVASPAASPVASPEASFDLELEAVDIAYSTKELSGPANVEFTITLTNNGVAEHDFVIDELDIRTPLLGPGESATVTINAPAGEYTYYCSVPGHRPSGMEGVLTLK